MPLRFHRSPLTGADGAEPVGMLAVAADVPLAAPVHLPGNVSGLARANVAVPPRDVDPGELIWFDVQLRVMAEFARPALVRVPVRPSLTMPAEVLVNVSVRPSVAAEFWKLIVDDDDRPVPLTWNVIAVGQAAPVSTM